MVAIIKANTASAGVDYTTFGHSLAFSKSWRLCISTKTFSVNLYVGEMPETF